MARNLADLPTQLPELAIAQEGFDAPSPQLIMLNGDLANQLGLSPQWLRSDAGLQFLTGHGSDSSTPVATAYAGHQFGNFTGLLGDGRALLLATVEAEPGLTGLPNPTGKSTQAYEIQAKGTGPTPFSRGGDGKATLSSALREYLFSEAMYALGIPTTRALAVIKTGEHIYRGSQTPFDNTEPTDELQPGGLVVRVASSHLRVGTFELVARSAQSTDIMDRLIEYAAERHGYDASAESLLRDVVKRQADLVAAWLACGFVHGVMNTDNASIAGETIDFGPCAFVDAHNPQAVFSSIDSGGRYAYGAQPTIAGWNMARFAETLLPQFAGSPDDALARAREILGTFADEFTDSLSRRWLPKLGILPSLYDDPLAIPLVQQWQALLAKFALDHTNAHRALIDVLTSDDAAALTALSDDPEFPASAAEWVQLWEQTREKLQISPDTALALMAETNPLYIPRNHLVTKALAAATEGDMDLYQRLLAAVTNPFEPQDAPAEFAEPAPAELGGFHSYCGT